MTAEERARLLEEYLDEHYKLDYEDMIAGTIPCRFKYRPVEPTTFGLTLTDIVETDDRDLNAHASLRKLAPYRPAEVQRADQERLASRRRLFKFYDLAKRRQQAGPR